MIVLSAGSVKEKVKEGVTPREIHVNVARLRFFKKWWESLVVAFIITSILIIVAGFQSSFNNLIISYFLMGFVIAFTSIITLRFYRNTEYFTTHAEMTLILSYGMIISAVLTLVPIILYKYAIISNVTLYQIERFFLFRIQIPQFGLYYGATPVLIVASSLLSILLYGVSVKEEKITEFAKHKVMVKTGGLTEGTERSLFEAYDVWLFIVIASIFVLLLVVLVLQTFFYANIQFLKPIYQYINHIKPPTYPPI